MQKVVAGSILSLAVLVLSACGTNQSGPDSQDNNAMKQPEIAVVTEETRPEQGVMPEGAQSEISMDQQSQMPAETISQEISANNEMIKDVAQPESIEVTEGDQADKTDLVKQKQPESSEPKS